MIHFYTWCLIVHSTHVLHRGSITVFLWSKIEMCDIDVCYRYTYWWHRVVDTYVSYLIISSILSLVNRIIFYRCNGERQIICKRYIDLSIISHIPHIQMTSNLFMLVNIFRVIFKNYHGICLLYWFRSLFFSRISRLRYY